MKKYKLIFEDRNGNELTSKIIEANSIKEARKYRDSLLANSMLNDLKKIKTKRIGNIDNALG